LFDKEKPHRQFPMLIQSDLRHSYAFYNVTTHRKRQSLVHLFDTTVVRWPLRNRHSAIIISAGWNDTRCRLLSSRDPLIPGLSCKLRVVHYTAVVRLGDS